MSTRSKLIFILPLLMVTLFACPIPEEGAMDGIWKPVSVRLQYRESPTAMPTDNTAILPDRFTEPWSGKEMARYIEIRGTSLWNHAHFDGDNTYYYTEQALNCDDNGTCTVVDDPATTLFYEANTALTTTYAVQDGHLVSNSVYIMNLSQENPSFMVVDVTHDRYEDAFPPTDWSSDTVVSN